MQTFWSVKQHCIRSKQMSMQGYLQYGLVWSVTEGNIVEGNGMATRRVIRWEVDSLSLVLHHHASSSKATHLSAKLKVALLLRLKRCLCQFCTFQCLDLTDMYAGKGVGNMMHMLVLAVHI